MAILTLMLLSTLSAGEFLLGFQSPGELAPRGFEEWKYDVVLRKKGEPLQGLVLENTAQLVTIRCITRKKGAPTVTFMEYIPREEIAEVVLLGPPEREKLQKRLNSLRNEQKLLSEQLKLLDPKTHPEIFKVDLVSLKTVDWPIEPFGNALQYTSTHFVLISNAREEMIQLVAMRLEQVYAAYSRYLPPRSTSAGPTTILLVRSLPEYQNHLQKLDRIFINQGYFDLQKNQVVCGSDLQRIGDDLEKSRSSHQRLIQELEDRKAELNQAYKGKVPPELLVPIKASLEQIKLTEERNNKAFLTAKQRLFQRLYHEAFHAYLNNSVYPAEQYSVPLWLNEGLAQIFESAIFEAGELQVGHADKERLDAVRKALERKELLHLIDLLRSGPEQFQVARSASQQVSHQTYLASWALTFHLTFERKILGSKAMDEYVRSLKRGVDPLVAFTTMTGQTLADFEKAHLRYLEALRPDGTAQSKP